MQSVGDGVTAIGIVTGQPEIVAAGGIIGKVGLGVGIVDNFANNGFNKETVTDALVKVSINVALDKLGDVGVSATRRVAGEEAVKIGGNKVSESIIQANTMAAEKIVDKIVEDK